MGEVEELQAAWMATGSSGPAAASVFDDLLARHRQPHRRYHGVRHVVWVVRHVRALTAALPAADRPGDGGAVLAAAFFHDAVYEPRAVDNEAASAALAERVLGELGWSDERRAAVAAMVRATERHRPEDVGSGVDVDPGSAVLIDADLAVLGSDPAAYQAYVTGVRAEYAHVPDPAWRSGRSAVLHTLVERQPLYLTAPGRSWWAARAKANMTAELAGLAGPRGSPAGSGGGSGNMVDLAPWPSW